MKLALTEVYEVATFYAHFDVVKEGETPPPAVTVRVCNSLSCAMAGAEHLLRDLPGKARTRRARRARALHGRLRPRAGLRRRPRAGDARDRRQRRRGGRARRRTRMPIDTPNDFDAYRRDGGYPLLEDCLAGTRTRDDVIKAVSDAGLRGLGGAGFPDRPQMDAGARRAGAAAVRGQCRRGRARHLQGPVLPRARSAPLHRGHADRRLGGRGAATPTSTSATNIPRCG